PTAGRYKRSLMQRRIADHLANLIAWLLVGVALVMAGSSAHAATYDPGRYFLSLYSHAKFDDADAACRAEHSRSWWSTTPYSHYELQGDNAACYIQGSNGTTWSPISPSLYVARVWNPCDVGDTSVEATRLCIDNGTPHVAQP